MNGYVADTHALFWYLIGSPRLGPLAKQALDEAALGQAVIYLPSIVLAELFFLNQKQGRPVDYARTYDLLQNQGHFEFVPLQASDVLDFEVDAGIPEMHDRIVAGVARRLHVPCLTRDVAMTQSEQIVVVWWSATVITSATSQANGIRG